MNIPVPFPYQGSKRNLAPAILSYIPDDTQKLIEAFAGSAAISLAASKYKLARFYYLNDLNRPLIQLWKEIINHPKQLIKKYELLWNEQHKNPRHYFQTRERFNKTSKPEYLLYLLLRCVAGAVRYNLNGEFNQSPDNRRFGTLPSTLEKRFLEVSTLLKGKTTCFSLDYKDILTMAEKKDLVYLDPPYQGVGKKRATRYFQSVDYDELVEVLASLNKANVSYLVSYDGKTGRKTHGKILPRNLNLLHTVLKSGRSSQATLLGKSAFIYESLYISPTLLQRLKTQPK